jgi:hypothetical protein
MSTVRANAILDASGGNTATINSMTPTADSLQGFRNRIINGDTRIDQRNAGAAVTPSVDSLTLDRYKYEASQASKFTIQQNAGSVTPPAGFVNYLGLTTASAVSIGTSDYFQFVQIIEGLNIGDLAWGTASAKTVTLSFWVRSSLTGTFGGSLRNSAVNRSYVFSYTISSANTWEQKSITIAGDTSGTWLTTNGIGIRLTFGLGNGSTFSGTAGSWSGSNFQNATGATSVVGTNGATFYITGVQFEVGSVATPFERIDYGRELMLCQRYYYKTALLTAGVIAASAFATTTVGFSAFGSFPVRLRTNPSALETSGTATDYQWNGASTVTCNAVPTVSTRTSTDMWQANGAVSSGLTAGQGGSFVTPSGNGYLAWSAEL